MRKPLAILALACLVASGVGIARYAGIARAAQPMTWGLYDSAYPTNMSNINSLNSQLGRKAQIVGWYREWSESCANDPTYLQQQIQSGVTPLIYWESYDGTHNTQNPYPLKSITAGQFDSYIDSCANAFKQAGGTMLLRLDQEMNDQAQANNGGYPWSVASGNQFGNTGADYAAAYQHVVSRLRTDGATNVKFVWNPDGDITNNPIPAGTYPGDSSVDYIGFDYYDYSSTPFQKDYNLIVQQSSTKPVLLGEMGANDSDGGQNYVNDLTNSITSGQAPRLYGAVWFNEGDLALNASTNPNTYNAVKNLLAQTSSGATPTPSATPTPTPPPATPTPTPRPTPTPTPAPTPAQPTVTHQASGGEPLKVDRDGSTMDEFDRYGNTMFHSAITTDGRIISSDQLAGSWIAIAEAHWTSDGKLFVRGRGGDGHIWQVVWSGGSWSGATYVA